MHLFQPLLNNLLRTPDGLSHRILFASPASEYDVPCEIYIAADRCQIIIAASTTYRLSEQRISAATKIAALACPHDLPFVIADKPSRRLVAIFPVAVKEINDGPLLDLLVLSTVRRLMAVVCRIDLCAGGLSIETVAAIDESALLCGTVALRKYRPFKRTR